MERFGAMIGFSKHMAFIKMSGKDCSSRKDPYITRSAMLKTLPASTSRALCFTMPLGYVKLIASPKDNKIANKMMTKSIQK